MCPGFEVASALKGPRYDLPGTSCTGHYDPWPKQYAPSPTTSGFAGHRLGCDRLLVSQDGSKLFPRLPPEKL